MDYTDTIPEVRTAFKETYGGNTEDYDERDIEKLNTNDEFTHAFLKFLKGDVKKTIDMLDVSFKWRKSIGLNDLKEDCFEKEILEKGNIYFHGKDKNDVDLFFFKFREIKSSETIKKYIAYMFEKHFKNNLDKKMVLIFDMSGVGLMGLDMDFFKYLLACATDYFPNTAYLLIFEMAWILNAAWNVLKNLMSAEVRKYVHMVGKSKVTEFVDAAQLPENMGGKDTYTYEHVPERSS
ncbi:motile sperm domain-containing protein 2-like isoform X2 [Tubulanus polymorphus]|uniref:motile sperm domain-containing protein 2-like isoform X2 n=1 Tax=Tubulanus polymorphus TaxID=672921 RepID=UPI003DA1FFEF